MSDLDHDPVLKKNPNSLDGASLNLSEAQLAFFKRQTGINNEEDLKAHIIALRAEAYAVHPYPCIKMFGFTRTYVDQFPFYDHVLKLGREGKIFLDLGCCFGTDVRKLVEDGYPKNRIVASDLREDFWTIGHKLFKTTPQNFPVAFVPGDVFDPRMLDISVPDQHTRSQPPPSDLSSLTSLQPLLGSASAIHATSFFHLFSEARQAELAKRFAALLSPEPGSVIFGMHVANTVRGAAYEHWKMFCHSPESWKTLWEEEVFEKGTVEVWTHLIDVAEPENKLAIGIPEGMKLYMLVWSVNRIA